MEQEPALVRRSAGGSSGQLPRADPNSDVLVLMMLGVLLDPCWPGAARHLAQTTNLLGTMAIILVLLEGGLGSIFATL